MKKNILLSMLTVAALFCSCSKQDDALNTPGNDVRQVTFTLSTADVSTRATTEVTLDRYVMEVYADAACTQPSKVFDGGASNRKEQTTGTFELILNSKDSYYCLFWADNDAAEVYDVTTLTAVTLKADATPMEGYHAMLVVTQAQTDHPVTLKRAVAKVTLNEEEKIKAGSSLKTAYDRHTTFNVATATTAGARSVEIITPITNEITGTANAPIQLAEFYTLASADGETATFRFTLNSEPAKEINNVPLKANIITHMKGEFSGSTSKTLTATASDNWKEMDIEVDGALLTATQLQTQLTTTTAKRWTISGTTTSDDTAIASVVSDAIKEVAARIFVTLPDVTSIGANTFQIATNLAAISLPKATEIGDKAFDRCKSLKTLTFGSVINSWGNSVLSNETSSTNIDLTLHKDQKSASGNIWNDYHWKSISYVDDNGNPIIK